MSTAWPAPTLPHSFLRSFELGPFATNCYIVLPSDAPTRPSPRTPCFIVDPGFDPFLAIAAIRELELSPLAILLTHAHADHIAGVADVARAFAKLGPLPIALHQLESSWMTDPRANLSAGMGIPVIAPAATRSLSVDEPLTLPRCTPTTQQPADVWRVLHTPGHSPGSVTFVLDAPANNANASTPPAAIVGDCLFAGSVGRTDFPGSNHATLITSIRTQLYTLPETTVIYPGHGSHSTIAREKRTNPFARP